MPVPVSGGRWPGDATLDVDAICMRFSIECRACGPMMSMCVRPLGAALEGIRKEGNNVGLRYKPAS